MWLVEAAGLRILCDPLLCTTHHAGVFEVVPRRRVDVAALRPDFIVVSHAHPDHFDVPSLDRLAQLDPESVVVTPDRLVAWAARQLGFATVHEVASGQRIELDGVQLVTTPSLGEDEWGVLVACDDGVAWNLVDSVMRDASHAKQVRDEALASVGRVHLDVALVRWQPMLEIAASLGHATAFPYEAYADLLAQAAAMHATALVPSACGGAHTAPYGWTNRWVYPVSVERFLRDVTAVAPDSRAYPPTVGARVSVRGGEVTFDPHGASALVSITEAIEPRVYRPFQMPPIVDANEAGHDEATMRTEVDRFVHAELAPALAEAWPDFGVTRPLTFVVEVTFPSRVDAYTLVVDGPGAAKVTRGFDDDWDALNLVAGSLLWEVIAGRRHWGDVILTGSLRALTRAYEPGPTAITRAHVGATFLYYARPYDDSVQRAVRWEVAQALQQRA